MSYFVILWNCSEQGIRNVKDSPRRAESFKALFETKGGKLDGMYYTFGQYNGVSIVEAPDDATLMSILLFIGKQGNARSLTLKAFAYDEATKIVENL